MTFLNEFLTDILLFKLHSPGAERIYTSQWNDECFFYGDCDCYMTRVLNVRENYLLKMTESSLRGQSYHTLTAQATTAGDKDNQEVNQDSSTAPDRLAEDSFLMAAPPSCILSLPYYLRSATDCDPSLRHDQVEVMVRDVLFDRRKISKTEEDADLLDEYIFPCTYPATISRFHRGVSRELDPLLPARELADHELYQETLPMLRVMCIREIIRKMMPDASNDNEEPVLKRRRQTRRLKEDNHCLERVSPAFRTSWDTQLTSWEVGEKLSASALLYVKE